MGTFGDVRALMQGAPSVARWRCLEALLGSWPSSGRDALSAQVVPYVEGYLEGWPPDMRVAPASWLARAARGEPCPELRLARVADCRELVGLEELEGLRRCTELTEEVARVIVDGHALNAASAATLRAVFPRAHALSAANTGLTDEVAAGLLHSGALEGWRALTLSGHHILDAGVLDGIARLEGLEALDLSRGAQVDDQGATWALLTPAASLRSLVLVGRRGQEPFAVSALLNCAWFGQLRRLGLSLRSAGAVGRLVSAPQLSGLEQLEIEGAGVDDASLRPLWRRDDLRLEQVAISSESVTLDSLREASRAPWRASLGGLALRGARRSARDPVRRFAREGLGNLRALRLIGTALERDTLATLLDTPWFLRVATLEISAQGFDRVSLERLTQTPLVALRRLTLRDNRLPPAWLATLSEAVWLGQLEHLDLRGTPWAASPRNRAARARMGREIVLHDHL